MDQEYLEDKVVTLRKLTGYQRLREVFSLIVLIVAVFLVIALGSFDQADPSWSQTAWHEPIHNAGGRFGAWTADVLFSIFGVVTYLLPLMLFIYSWNVFKQRHTSVSLDNFTLSLRVIGFVALILSSCSLADLNFDDWHNFTSGGVLGSLISNAVIPLLNHLGATLTLIFMWLIGFTLFTGWSWLMIAEKVGSVVMVIITFIFNKLRAKDEDELTEDEEEELIDDEQSDILLSDVPEEDSDDENDIPENQLAFNLEIPDDKPSIKFVPQYPPIETEPTIAPLQLDTRKSDASNTAQESTDRISQLVNSIADKHIVSDVKRADDQVAIEQPQVTESLQDEPVKDKFVKRPTIQNVKKPVFTPARTKVIPDLPRPNPVRIPTRRELMSYGIRLPSQANANNNDLNNKTTLAESQQQGADFDEQSQKDALRQQFAEQQKQRYGSDYSLDENDSNDNKPHVTTYRNNNSLLDNYRPTISTNVEPMVYSEIVKPETHESGKNFIYDLPANDSIVNVSELEKQHLAYEYKNSFNPVSETALSDKNDSLLQDSVDRTRNAFDGRYQEFQRPGDSSDKRPAVIEQFSRRDESLVPEQRLYKISELKKVYLSDSDSANADKSAVNQTEPDVKTEARPALDGLIHPFLMRNDKPLYKPTTPLPTLDLLTTPPALVEPIDYAELEQIARLIEERLADYRVKANVVDILPGPVITLYELDLAPGVKAARISNLSRDIARSLSTVAVRVVEVIPGRPYVGLELPNKHRQTVYVREVLDCAMFRDIASPLAIVLGKDISGQPVVADLAKMPHVLVAGTTGSGKSVGVNAMIISMLYKATPDEVRFIMIDPKMLELSVYEGIPHLLTEVVTDMKDAANALRWCVGEMERRYKLMSALGVRNLAGYNERIQQAIDMGRPVPDPFWKPTDSMDMNCPTLEKLPYIVVIVDEFADLMMAVGKKVEELIARLAQKARAAGIHLVLATQRPSVDVITGLIKANIPTRIAFTVSSKIDSRTILDQGGAESLLGMGDMLYLAPNSSTPIRVHGAFVRDEEVHAVVQDWKARGKPQYIDSITKAMEESENGFSLDGVEDLDPLFDQAVAFVVEKRKPSISGVQRQFRIGYNRAARIIEQMEAQGIVSPPGNNGNREVLAPPPHD